MKRLLLIAGALSMAACSQINTGNVGVESTLGQVKPDTMVPGVYFTAFKTVVEVCAKEVPIQIENLKPQTSDKITLSDLDIDIYLSIDSSKAPAIMTKWPGDLTEVKGDDCSRVGANYVARQAREVIYDAASKFGSATIHTERTKIAALIVKQLQANLDAEAGKGLFLIASANVRNLITDPALEADIKAAAQAQFKLNNEKNLLEVTKVQADRKREEAKGEADAIRIKATAVSTQGGKEYVELKAIEKWDGKLPVTQAGGAVPFVNLK